MDATDLDHENAGWRRLFGDDGLSVGTGFPLTGATESTPTIERELELAEHAEAVGFDALWARDVPTYWPRFGDAGQTFDTWPWLSQVAARTDAIALGTASVALTLRHPIHVAKAAATVDRLSNGRLVLGVASGDRDPEFPAFDVPREERGERFRESVAAVRACWAEEFPEIEGDWGRLDGELDVVPKPTSEVLPLLPTGHARQSIEWIAEHGDGWFFYHLPDSTLESYLEDWRALAGAKPFAMVLRLEFADDPAAEPEPLHQGYRAGVEWTREYVRELEALGVDHLLVGQDGADRERALTRFADEVLDEL